MNELDLHYPPEACPFCNIAAAFPSPSSKTSLWTSKSEALSACIPTEEEADPEKTSPTSFVVMASEDVIAFLDILPMTRAHLLVATRGHRVKVADMGGREGCAMGEFWPCSFCGFGVGWICTAALGERRSWYS